MGIAAKSTFDVQDFLAKLGVGKTILKFQKNQTVFTQGDTAEAVYYIQRGKIKLTVISQHDKEAVVGILGPGQFFGEGCMNGTPCASRPRPPSKTVSSPQLQNRP